MAHPVLADQPVSAEFAHSGFAQVFPRRAGDAKDLARRLGRACAVWKASVSASPVPAGSVVSGKGSGSRNFESAQGYLHSGPNGLGALDLRRDGWAGADGEGIIVCDLESGWNFHHEDLRVMTRVGGEFDGPGASREHGTAVMGVMLARAGRSGLIGMVPRANGYVSSAMIDGAWNVGGAIAAATRRLQAGDVILIELQDKPAGGTRYVAMQYWDSVFSAIRAATDKGVTVVQAAGNGDENFDRSAFTDTGLQKDSGAITVGAGVPPTNYLGYDGDEHGFEAYESLGPPRSRLWFSNYGGIVDVQAWGWNVTTLGYGDAQGGHSNRWFTHRFSGTSSAAPMVAAAVVAIQSRAKQELGEPLAPHQVRRLLVKSGWPQVGFGPSSREPENRSATGPGAGFRPILSRRSEPSGAGWCGSVGGVQGALDGHPEPLGESLGGELLAAVSGGVTQCCQVGTRQCVQQGGRSRGRVERVKQQPVLAVVDQVLGAARVYRAQGRSARKHRFLDHQPPDIHDRRKHVEVGGGEPRGDVFGAYRGHDFDAGDRLLTNPVIEWAAAQEHQAPSLGELGRELLPLFENRLNAFER